MDETTGKSEHTFRTKTGTCTITPKQIILTHAGARGRMAEIIFGNSMIQGLIISGLIAIIFIAGGILFLVNANYLTGTVLSIFGIIFIWNIIASRNNSAALVIERPAIHHVTAHTPRPPLTRGYFAVYFDEQGKQKKRLIMLPGSFSDGRKEYQKAIKIMQESGLLNKE